MDESPKDQKRYTESDRHLVSRSTFFKRSLELGTFIACTPFLSDLAAAAAIDGGYRQATLNKNPDVNKLIIQKVPFHVSGQVGKAITINGTLPGPLLRLREGTAAVIQVINKLDEVTSIHWHGVLVPPAMDGVPGVTFAGIGPGEVFTYRFPVKQSGTYWYHSHSGGQELMGMYGPIIIDPLGKEPFKYDRDYVVVLSDWSFEDPMAIIGKLKKDAGYYNFQKRDLSELVAAVSASGISSAMADRLRWAKMRMDPTDLADVTGYSYTYLLNGLPPSQNWTGIFRKGERVRLRFIAAGAMTLFDVRIPGLKMTVVQADGQNIKPVTVDEFRIAPGETYDVIVEPNEERAYAVFAETMDRSGYASGVLAPRTGLIPPVPERRRRPVRGMDDMGMAMSSMQGMDMGKGAGGGSAMPADPAGSGSEQPDMPGMPGMKMPLTNPANGSTVSAIPRSTPVKHGPDHHGAGNAVVPEETRSRLSEPGIGLGQDGRTVLVYADLQSLSPNDDLRQPSREIELHLTGNMDRYMWSIDGKTYSESPDPILLQFGERLRLTLVNDTMMEHPMHLHGMWMSLENGHGNFLPRKHTIVVKPAERLSVAITAETPGRWAFHCHLLLHMEMGMFRVIEVVPPKVEAML